ncbi:MAG: DUF4065 domain-containing protein [Duodenibacillus sp.]|nr:DUF4065 domain-containing protein [Duodenibacillus sp.]
MELDSVAAMAYVIRRCTRTCAEPGAGSALSHAKAQRLLYCCYGIVLAKTGERLTAEHPRAWPYGPVFPACYSAFRHRGPVPEGKLQALAAEFEAACPADVLSLVDRALAAYGSCDEGTLTAWSRLRDSPWAQAEPLMRLDDLAVRNRFLRYLEKVEAAQA